MQKELEHIKTLTAGNNHTGARYYIASLFSYLSLYKRRFDLISELQSIDGHLNHNISVYSNEITDEMLNIIKEKEGIDVYNEIHSTL